MMKRALPFVAWMSMLACAHAENGCPAGYEPWKTPVQSTSDCMAIPNYGQSTKPVAAGAQWISRWGAIAIGSTVAGGGVGTTIGENSRWKAESAAIKACCDTGGGPACKVFSYHDQCAAVAWGIDSYAVRSAESIDLASSSAMAQCRASTGDCRIFYSACSLPERAS